MPELPEVETVARSLDRLVAGKKILAAALHREKLAPRITAAEFARLLAGRVIERVGRRGKYLLFDLDGGLTLLVHLRMSGRFRLLEDGSENPRFTHAEFFLEEDARLVFEDQRHFGYMNVVPTTVLWETRELKLLAPEPLSGEFTREYVRACLASSRRPVKLLLLDQRKVAGLGNIYAAEALYRARVHPQKPANGLSAIKSNRLHAAIVEVLRFAIDQSELAKLDPDDLESGFYGSDDQSWLVYDREGAPCHRCGNGIRRLVQSGRSSYFCPRCQRM